MNEQKQEISSSSSSQLKAEAGLKRVFNVEQKGYFEKLKAEMRTIANGRTVQEMYAEKDLKSLREWVKRRGKMIEFLETKKMPDKELDEVEIDILEYLQVNDPIEIGGWITFWAQNKEGKYVVVKEDGTELGLGKEYQYVGDPVEISGKIVFKAQNKEGKYVVVKEDKTELGLGKEYKSAGAPVEISGKIAFLAVNKEGKWMVVNESGEEISDEFDGIYKIKQCGEKKFYVIAKTGQKYMRKVFELPLAPA